MLNIGLLRNVRGEWLMYKKEEPITLACPKCGESVKLSNHFQHMWVDGSYVRRQRWDCPNGHDYWRIPEDKDRFSNSGGWPY